MRSAANITEAAPHVWGFAAGNDLTRRDLQAEAKAMKRPWDMAKGFDLSAVVGPIRPGPLDDGLLTLTVDGVERQRSRLSAMPGDMIAARAGQLPQLARDPVHVHGEADPPIANQGNSQFFLPHRRKLCRACARLAIAFDKCSR